MIYYAVKRKDTGEYTSRGIDMDGGKYRYWTFDTKAKTRWSNATGAQKIANFMSLLGIPAHVVKVTRKVKS